MQRCYLAGPDVFHPEMAALAAGKRALCSRYGLQGCFPLDNEEDLSGLSGRAAALLIYRANIRLIESCDVMIANLTPFRGASADAGTVFELGYMAARGRPVAAYSLDAGSYLQRLQATGWAGRPANPGEQVNDRNGQMVEDFGLGDNLMLAGALETAPAPGEPAMDRWLRRDGDWRKLGDHLAAFEDCLKLLTARA